MSKYLLEVGVEELPYKFIPMAISQLETGFKTFLESNNVGFESIATQALKDIPVRMISYGGSNHNI